MGEKTKHSLTHEAVLTQAVLCHVAEASHGGAVVPRIPESTVKGINSVRAGSIPAFGMN